MAVGDFYIDEAPKPLLNDDTTEFTVQIGFYDTVTEVFEATSILQEVEYRTDCNQQDIALCYLNNLGSYEYWLFTGEKEYGYTITDSQRATKSNLDNWDQSFVDGTIEDFFFDVTAKIQRRVFSQLLNFDEARNLAQIKYSLRVYEVLDSRTLKMVLVDKGDITYSRDNNPIREIEFEIVNTDDIPIQKG